MTDDWSTPTGENDLIVEPALDEATSDLDQFDDVEERNEQMLDAFFHELALEASNDPTPNTPEEQAEDDALMAWAERLMATTPPGPGTE